MTPILRPLCAGKLCCLFVFVVLLVLGRYPCFLWSALLADHNLPIIFKCNGRSYEKSEENVTTYIDYSEPKKISWDLPLHFAQLADTIVYFLNYRK